VAAADERAVTRTRPGRCRPSRRSTSRTRFRGARPHAELMPSLPPVPARFTGSRGRRSWLRAALRAPTRVPAAAPPLPCHRRRLRRLSRSIRQGKREATRRRARSRSGASRRSKSPPIPGTLIANERSPATSASGRRYRSPSRRASCASAVEAGEVRRQNHAIERPERRVGGERLDGENVDRRAAMRFSLIASASAASSPALRRCVDQYGGRFISLRRVASMR